MRLVRTTGERIAERGAMKAREARPEDGNDRDEANQCGMHTGTQLFVAGPGYCGRHTTLSHLSSTTIIAWHHLQLTSAVLFSFATSTCP
jgi:hypothetical protein